MCSQQTQYPTPTAYFKYNHGKLQSQPVQFQANNNILPNELFTVSSNCCQDPRFIMPSVNAFPRTASIQKQANVPLTLHITPFPQNVQVQLITEAPQRCNRCGAYPSHIDKIVGSDSICGLCGRRNQLGTIQMPQQQAQGIAVDYLVTEGKYSVATTNGDGRTGELLNPGTVSHVAANVLTTVNVKRECSTAVDYRKPNTLRLNKLEPRQIEEEVDIMQRLENDKTHNIYADQTDSEKNDVQFYRDRLEEIQRVKQQQIQIVIIPITQYTLFQSLFSQVIGVLSQYIESQKQYEECCKQQNIFQNLKPSKYLTIPVFTVGDRVFSFRNSGNFEVFQLFNDIAGGECILPLPAVCLAVPEDTQLRAQWEQRVIQFLQAEYSEMIQIQNVGVEASTGRGLADAIVGAISSLQASGGSITFLLTQALQNDVLKTPIPPGSSGEAGQPQKSQMYKEVHYDNVGTCQEATLYTISSEFQRLADEAAAHAISINAIAVPIQGEHLGLTQVFSLCQKTGGRLFYCPAVAYATDLEQTGLQYFVLCSIYEVLNAPGRLCTATLRASSGLQVDFQKCSLQAWNVGVSGFSGLFGGSKQMQTSNQGLIGGGIITSDVEWHVAQLTYNQTFSCDVTIDGELPGQSCAFQLALLHTGRFGRTIRVVTVQYAVASTAGDVFNGGNQFALAAALGRRAAHDFLSRPTSSALLPPVCFRPNQATNAASAVTNAAGQILDGEEAGVGSLAAMQPRQLQALSAGAALLQAQSVPDGAPRLSYVFTYRTHIRDWLVRLLATFRKLTGRSKDPRFLVSYVQQLMPLYAHSLIRVLFLQQQRQQNEGGIITADMRIADAAFMLYAPPLAICRQLVPGIYRVRKNWWAFNDSAGEENDPSDVEDQDTQMGPVSPGAGVLPFPIQPDSMHVRESYRRVYLFCTPQVFVLKVGKQTPEWLITSIKQNGLISQQIIYDFDEPGMQALLQNLRTLYNYTGSVYVSFGDDFFALLAQQMYIMDPVSKYQSYRDFLSGIYVSIQAH